MCDGKFDCPDLSDECLCQDVKATSVCRNTCFGNSYDSDNCLCPLGEVPCIEPNTPVYFPAICISMENFCDGVIDCPNRADEISCGKSKECATSPMTTVPHVSAFSGSILINTPDPCTPNHICSKSMDDNIWTPKYAVACDGKPECFDLEDECDAGCGTPLPNFCDFRNFEKFYACPEGGVIPGVIICDGLKNCSSSGQDEIECPYRFYCKSGEIVSIEEQRKCDFIGDCEDESDEIGCEFSHFYCENSNPLFVPLRLKFDGKNDCSDGSDECPKTSFDSSIFSSRENLIANPFLKGMVWVMGLLSITGNSFVMFNTMRSFLQQTKKFNNVAVIYNFLIFNLAVADIIMGVFLISLGIQDSMSSGKYCKEDKQWRSGSTCKLFGVLATISSETSIVILGILSSYRLMCVVRPLQGRSLRVRSVAIITAITWCVTTLLALIPIFPPFANYFVTSAWLAPNPFFLEDVVDRNSMETFSNIANRYLSKNHSYLHLQGQYTWASMGDTLRELDQTYTTLGYFGYYSTHAVCLPKIFVKYNDTAWQYSAMLTVFNFSMFVYIVFAYIRLSRPTPINKSSQRKHSATNVNNRSMQRRIAMLVATDFACWVPTCMIGFLQLGGVPVPAMVYALTAIVLLPINSALNPILYSDSIQGLCVKILAAFSWTKSTIGRHLTSNPRTKTCVNVSLTNNNTSNINKKARRFKNDFAQLVETEAETML